MIPVLRSSVASAVAPLSSVIAAGTMLPLEALAQQSQIAVTPELFERLAPEQQQLLIEGLVGRSNDNVLLLALFLAFVAVVTACMFWFTHRLHTNFMRICADNQQVAVFAQAPAGLPAGTIRSLMALFIVLTGIGLVLMTLKGGPFEGFPEVMAGVLGTVLGFYFGSRTATSSQEREATREISEISQERNVAVSKVETNRLDRTVETVKEGIAVAKAAKAVLPPNLRGTVEAVIEKAEGGLRTIGELRSAGSVGEAIEKALRLATDVRKDGAVGPLLSKAIGSFGAALGGTVPPLGLAVTIATVAARLTGAAYERWLARVLDAPYTPALFPPSVIDANTGFVLLRKSPGFAAAFAPEIERGDRQFVNEFVRVALSDGGSEAVRSKYPDRFATLQEVDEALQQFQQAAIELEVMKDLTAEMTAEAGGTESLMRAIDRINAHEEARADLDALVLVIDKLRQADQPVEKIIRNARQELEG